MFTQPLQTLRGRGEGGNGAVRIIESWMKTLDNVSGLYSGLVFSEPFSCLDEAI